MDSMEAATEAMGEGPVLRAQRRRASSSSLTRSLATAQGIDQAQLLLKSGVWFDGVAVLMKQIETQKDNADLIAARDALLVQVGLQDVATKSPQTPAGKAP